MFKTLTDNSKAAIFTVMVLLLTVTVAASINLFSTTSEFLSIVLYMFTPALTALIMMLVVTRDGFSREGWKPLGLHRLGLKAWWIAFLLPLVVGVVATALVWATPLASFVVPERGMGTTILGFAITVVLATLTLSLGEELGWRGYLLPRLLGVGRTRALVLVGLIWAAWHVPLIFLTPPLPRQRQQAFSPVPVRRNDRGRQLLLWLPQDMDGQRVAGLHSALGAQRRLGHPRSVHRGFLPCCGQPVPRRGQRDTDLDRDSGRGGVVGSQGQQRC
jgi:membrane protease YdiL (CAAX protease family)